MNRTPLEPLRREGTEPVLVDVGGSGGPPRLWRELAPISTYVAFDPDAREFSETGPGRWRRSLRIPAAVVDRPDRKEVPFFLTRSPYCSSTLRPDHASLSRYLFDHLFEVVGRNQAPATTLAAVVRHHGLPGIDWLKVDSQGTDLRLVTSLPPALEQRLLAVDVEPGLIPAYQGEDLFVDCHRELTERGFWLSNLRIEGAIRMTKASLAKVTSGDPFDAADVLTRGLKKSPGWCEARYLRSVESVRKSPQARRDLLLLWTFAMLDQQPGFALDVAAEFERRFGLGPPAPTLQARARARVRLALVRGRLRHAATSPARFIQKLSRRGR